MLNVDPGKLRKGSVPMLCAKTGVPTSRLRRQWLLDFGEASLWWILWSLGIYLLIRACRSTMLAVELPIAPGVAARYRAFRLARALGLAGVLLVFGGSASWPVCLAAAAAWWLLHGWTRAQWVRVRWNGTFVRLDAHPALIEALREEPKRAFVPAAVPATPVPGWYADPTGRDYLRYWDGAQWTAHLAAYPA